MISLDHLHPNVRHLVSLPNEDRIRHLRPAAHVHNAKGDAALRRFLRVFEQSKTFRPRNTALTGLSNMGKTTVIQMLRQLPDAQERSENDIRRIPLLCLTADARPDAGSVFGAILDKTGRPYNAEWRYRQKKKEAYTALKLARPLLMVLDQAHRYMRGTFEARAAFLQELVQLNDDDDLHMAIALVGLPIVKDIVRSIDETANRFPVYEMSPWTDSTELRQFIGELCMMIPLCNASDVTSDAVVKRILELTEGLTGEIIDLLTFAAQHAIGGSEKISLEEISACDFVPISERRSEEKPFLSKAAA